MGAQLADGSLCYKPLFEEAMRSTVAAARIFENCPDGTVKIVISLRTSGITLTFTGKTPTAATVGQDIALGGFQELFLRPEQARAVLAINNGGVATGYITYFGVA